ncbi:N-6 DNA methylase (plasmid) [Mesorhizobium muleiense]|uniref:N-6 DNA methylase n=1 Tax=Mesorhizobium muleiense TaxID=1004279 RepID=UPI003AFA8636
MEVRFEETEGGFRLPVLAKAINAEGHDAVWIVEALSPHSDDFGTDPLSLKPGSVQYSDHIAIADRLTETLEEIIGNGVFDLVEPPRFVVVAAFSSLILIDRRHWPRRAVLRFDLNEIFRRKEMPTFQAMAALLHRESVSPTAGRPLIDRIAEESHRHANAVSTSLKSAMRDAIEVLGNEVLAVTGGRVRGELIDEKELTLECLRYMYRLLFLFYVEARQDLGFAPMKSDIYRKGYSLEQLRELELVPLRTKEDREGTYLSQTVNLLLDLMFQGTQSRGITTPSDVDESEFHRGFALEPVRVELLDPSSTPLLSALALRNEAVQKIIKLMSLSTSRKGGSRPGRISYAQLGISQLGAVYETLLSFSGFIAREPLIEVKKAGNNGSEASPSDEEETDETTEEMDDELAEVDVSGAGRADRVDLMEPAWFVPASRAAEFSDEEMVYDGVSPRTHPKGSFLYRLWGRDRQDSASYYTPEPLARLLVSQALEELLKDKKADEILKLRILEPAMGSAAFLVEATNQLADAYLGRKQEELKRQIPQEGYAAERQRVRAYIADRNCFGVDLNPVAVELGQISMWLNSLHPGGLTPWFRDQVHAGNSLTGARRAAWSTTTAKGKAIKALQEECELREIGWKGARKDHEVWHFLVPDLGMVNYDMKVIAELDPDNAEKIKQWRSAKREKGSDIEPFFGKISEEEIKELRRISKAADALFETVADEWERQRAETNDSIVVWPENRKPGQKGLDFIEKMKRLAAMQGNRAGNSTPWKRLKAAMDAWCSLWFWPVEKADLLPDRRSFLLTMSLLLEGQNKGGKVHIPAEEGLRPKQGQLFETVTAGPPRNGALFGVADVPAAPEQTSLLKDIDDVDVDSLRALMPWLAVAEEIAERQRFVHFDLVFADVLRERGGFDLIVGNPPWLKPSWNDGIVMGGLDPVFAIRGFNAKQIQDRRADFLNVDVARRTEFLDAFVAHEGFASMISQTTAMPFLKGGANNLYKCFIDLAFRLVGENGYAALIHQDNHLTDPKGGEFREQWYCRIRKHFQFNNEIKAKMFSEVHNNTKFSLNVYSSANNKIAFQHISNLFLPQQVDECFDDSKAWMGQIPGIKDDTGKWETKGHPKRRVTIDQKAFEAIARVAEEDVELPILQSRFVMPYSTDTVEVFRAFSDNQKRFSQGAGELQMDPIWHESGAQKQLKVIERKTAFQTETLRMVMTGPLFYVGNPVYKTPNRNCNTNKAYEAIDLSLIPDDYLPRANYAYVEASGWREKLPGVSWDPTKKHTDFYRIAFRNMMQPGSERSLTAALVPPGTAHVNTIETVAFQNLARLVVTYPSWISLPFDFLTKAAAITHFFSSTIRMYPWIKGHKTAQHRALRLACLTSPYAEIWNDHATTMDVLPWSFDDPRLDLEGPVEGPARWDRTAGLRTDFARRQALVEIDVLVAMALGISVDQLCDMYRIHFGVLRQNENGTWYDQNGKIVWTCSKGLLSVGYLNDKGKSPSRKAWEEEFASMTSGELRCKATIDFLPRGPHQIERVFRAPFTKCDRTEDYRRAWAHFEKLGV